jgi:hypothetical protein
MKTRSIRGLTLYFDAPEEEAAGLIGNACERSIDLLRELWGLEVPGECRVYIMTSWLRFLFHSAPWPWRIYLAATLPLRYGRIQRLWNVAGGWAQRYGKRQTIGLKPPRLLRGIDAGLRERIFVHREVDEWVQHNTCHELVHACTGHLRLPTWLHEGLAMVTVDRLAGKPTVKADTLEALTRQSPSARPQEGYGGMAVDPDRLLYLAARGYWITRYLADTQTGLLRGLLEQRQSHEVLEGTLAAELGMNREEFRDRIDGIVVAYFAE